MTNDEACTPTKPVPARSEVLLFPSCAGGVQTGSCFAGSPLYMKVRDGGPYDLAPQTVPGRGAPVVVKVAEDLAPSLNSTVTTDEGASFQTNDPHKVGETAVSFANFGPHDIIATEVDSLGKMKVPARMALCVSEGNDGFCGSPRVGPPDQIPYEASPCDTNGHDGLCGTIDKTGPVTNVTNITHKQVFARKKAPKLVTGTVAEDPAVVKNVRLRLTRTSTGRVLIKLKHRSPDLEEGQAALPHGQALQRVGRQHRADREDQVRHEVREVVRGRSRRPQARTSSTAFDLTLPAGAYTLEVQAADDGQQQGRARAGAQRHHLHGEDALTASDDQACGAAHWASARSPSGSPSGVGICGVSRRYHSASSAAWQPEPAAVIAWR